MYWSRYGVGDLPQTDSLFADVVEGGKNLSAQDIYSAIERDLGLLAPVKRILAFKTIA
jgi:hypothetical protein